MMRGLGATGVLTAMFAMVELGCYNPSVPAGVPCSDDGACPTGQACIAGYCDASGEAFPDATDTPLPDMLPSDEPPLCTTWTPRHFVPCDIPAPGGDLNLTQALAQFTWNTDDGELRGVMGTIVPVTTVVMAQTDGPDVLLASVQDFTVEEGVEVDVRGDRPLIVAVWGSAEIAGTIEADADYNSAGPGGSGALSSLCLSGPTGDNGDAGPPATGGGGGAFQGDGGTGGNTASGGGIAIAPPTVVRGGCAGGRGGPNADGAVGTRGAGGGAVQISARVAITVTSTGVIDAGGGAGSRGRAPLGGGGGGGSGGYIGLDAPSVTIDGLLAANGGSGGGGASDVQDGNSGFGGSTGTSAIPGGQGASTSNVGTCTRGGNGSSVSSPNGGDANSSPCGGSGGGGGAGYILLWSPNQIITGTVSPPAIDGPE